MNIDWKDPKAPISTHFTVKDALYLPSWQIMHIPSEAEQAKILVTAQFMEVVREFLGRPINVHVWTRPVCVNAPGTSYSGRNYNALVGGAANSAHIYGDAVDWNPSSMVCDEARHLLQPKLVEFGLRMENKPGSNWVHLDNRPVLPGHNRFFIP
jgi:hypothetical protein